MAMLAPPMPRPKPQMPGQPQEAPAPFVWGADGEALTPEQVAQRRAMAQEMLKSGMDFSPVQSWTQGAARVAQALVGGLNERRANEAQTAGRKSAQDALAAYQTEESEPGTDPKAHIAHALSLADNPWLGDGARAVLMQSLKKEGGGPFAGTGYDASSSNILVQGQKDPAVRASPQYALAWANQTQPRVVQDAQGRSVLYTPPPPQGILPPIYPQGEGQQQPAPAPSAPPAAPPANTPPPSPTGSAAPIPGLDTGKPELAGSPMMLDIRGPDGTMQTVLGQQLKNGQWVTADEKRAPLGSPEGVTPPGGSGRFQVQAGRVMSAAEDVLRTVTTINAMPITASSGVFGMAETKTSFLGAPLNYLRQRMNDQDVQSYNALSQGLARSVVTIENQGLAPTDGAIASAAAQLMVQPGDTYLTRIQKQAEFRQHTEAHLTPMLHGPMTTPEQKDYIRKTIADLHNAIPYTVQDIINYSRKPGTTTFGDYARSTVLKPKPQAAAAPSNVVQEHVPGGPPAGAQPPAAGGWSVKRIQ